MLSSKVLLAAGLVLLFVCLSTGTQAGLDDLVLRRSALQSLWPDQDLDKRVVHLEKNEVLEQVAALRSRAKRQSGSSPVIHGDFTFNDLNRFGRVYYSGGSSPVIIVLTYSVSTSGAVTTSNLYRSDNYGRSFEQIDQNLDPSVSGGPTLWYNFHIGNSNKNLVVFAHASEPKIFYSFDEGVTWSTRSFSISSIEGTTLVWNTQHDWALAHDSTNNKLYVTKDLCLTWILLSDNVDSPFDYQWGDPKYYDETSVFYNTYDPNDRQRGDFTVGLYVQTLPYNNPQLVDPNLGRHNAFLIVGPYTFVHKTENGVVYLYTSYKEEPFKKAMIPNEDPHQTYYVAHIDELQALVIVEHDSGQNNLYLSDEKGVYFSLSLPDIVVEGNEIDLEVVNGVNGTLIANQYVRAGPGELADTKRTLITLDNGGEWTLVLAPDRYKNGITVNCDPPQCSLHFHMSTTEYARTGVYSVNNAPGLIIAHGTIGSELSDDPDLFLSRDGGVTWEQTLTGSWGITVADHGGLMVAAQDYHQYTSNPSTELQYSCNEGQTWTGFNFTSEPMVVFGVLTEPGEYTTTVSLYGVKPTSTRAWDVVTVNFSTIFERNCISTDFYYWMPWDDRTDTDCILGADVQIERRRPNVCCLVGPGYVRTVLVSTCKCTDEDYDCDYGFKHSNEFDGPCIRDLEIQLDDPCLTGKVISYNKSTGYRKIPGDICVNGVEATFEPQPFLCCESPTGQTDATTKKPPTTQSTTQPTTQKPTTGSQTSTKPGKPTTDAISAPQGSNSAVVGALGGLLAIAVLVAIILGVLALVFASKHSKARRQYLRLATSGDGMGGGGISFVRDSDNQQQVLLSGPESTQNADGDDDDVEPLPL